MLLRQLESNDNVGGRIYRLTVASGRMEANQLGDAAGLLVKSVAKAVDNALDDDLSSGGKCNPQDHVSFNSELPCLGGVCLLYTSGG